jgi:hypothetical protein
MIILQSQTWSNLCEKIGWMRTEENSPEGMCLGERGMKLSGTYKVFGHTENNFTFVLESLCTELVQ